MIFIIPITTNYPDEQEGDFILFMNYLNEKYKELNYIQNHIPYHNLKITIEKPPVKDKSQHASSVDASIRTLSFPIHLQPYPEEKKFYRYLKPDFIKAIYINNRTPFRKQFKDFTKKAKENGINTLVIDIQPKQIPQKTIHELKKQNFYLIARIVVFHLGFDEYPPNQKHLKHIYKLLKIAESAVISGFHEIQLDYIRFADFYHPRGLNLGKRYRFIAGILKLFENRIRPYGIRMGADIFGRIPFYDHDYIGQRIELFDRYVDHIHPMLYPSHFYGMKKRINNPYQTVYEGVLKSKEKSKKAEIIPYIQAFKMSIRGSGLSFKKYIQKQIEACIDSKARGFIAWNARNEYQKLYEAMKEVFSRNQKHYANSQ